MMRQKSRFLRRRQEEIVERGRRQKGRKKKGNKAIKEGRIKQEEGETEREKRSEGGRLKKVAIKGKRK